MKFHYVAAVSACTQCDYTAESRTSTLSGFYLSVAFAASLPLCFILFRAPWSVPWYSFFGIVAGEVLAFFAIGFITSPFLGLASRIPTSCPRCEAPVTFRGRYFSDSPRPRIDDIVLFTLFTIANVAAIIYVWPSRFFQ